MEKRLVIFLLLSVLILTSHVMIRNLFFPPARPVAQQADGLGDEKGDKQQKDEDKKSKQGGMGKGEQVDGQPGAEPSEKKAGKEPPAEMVEALPGEEAKTPPSPEEGPPEPAQLPQQWFTLGTFTPESPYRLLVTFDNRGASIERVELVARDAKGRLRYRDLGKPYGYLGLQYGDTPDKCVVTVVAPGTPAALAKPNDGSLPAGFAVDDVVVGIVVGANIIPIRGCDELESYLASSKPDQSVTFLVKRNAKDVQLTTILDHWPLQLVQRESVDDDPAIPSYLMGLHSLGTTVIAQDTDQLTGVASLRNGTWHVTQPNETEIIFTKRVTVGQGDEAGELEFVKRFRLGSPAGSDQSPLTFSGYNLQLDIEIHNLGAIPQTVSYALDGPNGLPLEGWWYTNKIHPSWGAAGARDVIWRVHGNRHSLRSASQIYKLVKDDPANPLTSVLTDNPAVAERTLDYLGVDTQYFAAVLMAGTMVEPKAFTCQDAYAMPVGPVPDLKSRGTKTLNTSFRMVSVAMPIEPGSVMTDQYHLFLGPKDPEVLADYDLADIIEYGWFGKIARPLSWLLHLFYGIFRNYGLAIIIADGVGARCHVPDRPQSGPQRADHAGAGSRDQEDQREVQERSGETGPSAARAVEETQLQPIERLLADVSSTADLHRTVSLPVG